MPRNLVICCDDTNNQFGTDRDPSKQRLFYDPGVGTLPEPSRVTASGKRISEIGGLAFGAGLTGKVENAYTFLMDSWELGDQVYLFGFSRGAYWTDSSSRRSLTIWTPLAASFRGRFSGPCKRRRSADLRVESPIKRR
jgi:uncharacterized protein (DUF2235 family)